jgi:hypothetical protein
VKNKLHRAGLLNSPMPTPRVPKTAARSKNWLRMAVSSSLVRGAQPVVKHQTPNTKHQGSLKLQTASTDPLPLV